MRFFKLAVPVLCAIALSACTGTTFNMGAGNDAPGGGMWVRQKPPSADKSLGPYPTGYAGQNKRGIVLKPPGLAAAAQAPAPVVIDSAGLTWNEVGDYESGFLAPASAAIEDDLAPIGSHEAVRAEPAEEGVVYNDAVKVFSLDGDLPGYNPNYAARPSAFYGMKAEELFFAHGSSKVKAADKPKLKRLAKDRRRDVSVTVVGHASKRVDGVKDPVKKKMINFAMAQKRANAVTGELKKAGLDPAWVQAVSKGDDEPNAEPQGKSQEAADRRVEIFMDEQ